MKTFHNLWPQLCTFENLHASWRNVRRRKSTRRQVILFEADLEDNLIGLLDDLDGGTYRPGA